MPETVLQTRYPTRVKACRVTLLAIVCLLALTGCGKRPGQVDPPPGISKDVYTREYPDIRTDGQR
jgi:hypothetical protein